ncbi:MAG: DMT family transporter [Cellulosilyticaceae bacterium]
MAFITALVSGLLMSVQGVWNTRITEKAGLWLTNCIVHGTGLLFCIAVLLVVRDENFPGLRAVNKWYLLSGIIGASIVYTVVVSVDKLGPAYAVMLILIAQVICAYIIELLGLFGTEKAAFAWSKIIGVGVMIIGIIVFQWKK